MTRTLSHSINKILWEDWDPIGVNGIGVADEYQSYADYLAGLCERGTTRPVIFELLRYFRTQCMMLVANDESDLMISDSILKFAPETDAEDSRFKSEAAIKPQAIVPFGNIPVSTEYYFDCPRIVSDADALLVEVASEDRRISYLIRFEFAIAFRVSREGDRLHTSFLLPKNAAMRTIYEVLNSNYERWLGEESLNIWNTSVLRHFCIVTQDDWIDVLSTQPPEVTLVTPNH
jgi:hypothetical protein